MTDDLDAYIATLTDEEREQIEQAERGLGIEHDVYMSVDTLTEIVMLRIVHPDEGEVPA